MTYEYYEQAQRLAEQSGARLKDATFTDRVELDLLMLAGSEDALKESLNELTHGKAMIEIGEVYEAAF